MKLRTQGGSSIFVGNLDTEIYGNAKIGPLCGKKFRNYRTKKIRACWIRSQSKLLRRVCNSTLQAETLSMLAGFDHAVAMKEALTELGFDVRLILLSDCGSLVDYLKKQHVQSSVTSSKRLEIDLELIRQAIEDGVIDRVLHIPGGLNHADSQTKKDVDAAARLRDAVTTAEIELPYGHFSATETG
jgi:phage FluMu gp28-like protein